MGLCKIEDCKNKQQYKKNLCNKHYRETLNLQECTVNGCKNKHKAKGLCLKHYDILRKTVGIGKSCTIDGCSRPMKGKNLCENHYKLSRRQEDVNFKIRKSVKNLFCRVVDCERNVRCLGLCKNHYDSYSYYKKRNSNSTTVEEFFQIRNQELKSGF
jgi:hypothetical protein